MSGYTGWKITYSILPLMVFTWKGTYTNITYTSRTHLDEINATAQNTEKLSTIKCSIDEDSNIKFLDLYLKYWYKLHYSKILYYLMMSCGVVVITNSRHILWNIHMVIKGLLKGRWLPIIMQQWSLRNMSN